ncbi:MAG: hypothetical protein ACK5Z2_05280 [Bacteroidota bacterium]|jgi:hypothetical protein
MKKPILLTLLISVACVLNAQQNSDEWYRFQLTGFAGYAHNFGKPLLPPNYSYSGPDGYFSVNYAGAKEVGAFSYGTSFLAFPSFFRFNRFCIAAGVGTLQLNTIVASDSIVQVWNFTSPPPAIGRSVLYDVRWNVQEQFVQFPVLVRAYFIRRGRFVTHSDIGFVPSLLLNRVENYFTADTYKKTFFGTSFYTADLNISYRIKSSNKYGLFITAGITSQMAVTETQKQRRPGMIGGLLGLRFDAY